MFLVLADMSGSTSQAMFMEMLNFAKSIDAKFAMFDTELRSLPIDAKTIDTTTFEITAGGGTDVERTLLGLEAINPTRYRSYEMIYVASDMYFPAPTVAWLENVRFVQTTPTADDNDYAKKARNQLHNDLKGRAIVVTLESEQWYRDNLRTK